MLQAHLHQARIAFKPQIKSNAKRFLVKTNKIAESDLDLYLTQVDGQWGTFVNEAGEPIKAHHLLAAAARSAEAELAAAPVATMNHQTGMFEEPALGPEEEEEDDGEFAGYAGASAFGAMVAPVAPVAPAAAPAVVVRDGKVVDPNAAEQPEDTAADCVYKVGDPCPLCQGAAGNITEHNPGVSCLCHKCGKVFSELTGREVRTGYKRGNANSGYKIEKERPQQNGITRRSAGTLISQIWAMFDEVGPTLTVSQAREMGKERGFNPTTVEIAVYRWRQFNGIQSRQAKAAK